MKVLDDSCGSAWTGYFLRNLKIYTRNFRQKYGKIKKKRKLADKTSVVKEE